MISQLGDLARLTMAMANWALLDNLQCLDDARPAKHMSTLR